MLIRKVCLVGVSWWATLANPQGSGKLGPHILSALQADSSFDVTVVTRNSSKATFPSGSRVVRVPDDYPVDDMAKVFRGHDAVVVSIANTAEYARVGLAEASIRAGIKRFIPSGYGGNIFNEASHHVHSITQEKVQMVKELRGMETGAWSWTYICNGIFLDFCLGFPFFGIDPKTRRARIWDDGNTTFSGTTFAGIGAAVVGVLRHTDETANRCVFVSTAELSLNSLLAAERKVSGTSEADWTIEHVKSDDQIKQFLKARDEATEWLPRMKATGGLALAMLVTGGYEQDFDKLGKLENGVLGVPRYSIEDIVRQVREG